MYSSDGKSSGHFDPLILGWVSATQRTLSGQSSYLFDNLKKMVVVAATRTKIKWRNSSLESEIGWTQRVQPISLFADVVT